MVIGLINKGLSYLLLLLAIIFYFFPYRYKTFYWLFFISFGVAIAFKFLLDKLKLKDWDFFIVLIAIWLNALGELWFYFNWIYYDKFLHLTVPFLICILYSGHLKQAGWKIDLFFPFTIIGMLASFEILEWVIHTYIGFPMLGVYSSIKGNPDKLVMDFLTDTMIDLIMGILGITTFLLVSKLTQKWRKWQIKPLGSSR